MDVRQNTSRRDGDTAKKLVQLLVVLDGEGDVTGDDTALLVIAGGVARQLEDFGAKVLEDGGEVDRSPGAHAGGVLSEGKAAARAVRGRQSYKLTMSTRMNIQGTNLPITQVTSNTTDGELKTSLRGSGGALLLATASLSFSLARHGVEVV